MALELTCYKDNREARELIENGKGFPELKAHLQSCTSCKQATPPRLSQMVPFSFNPPQP